MLIDTKALWFAPLLKNEEPIEWLAMLEPLVRAALANEPVRAQPSRVEAGAQIVGPVAFGADCVVGHGALVVGPAIFGDRCVIGHCSEVARSVFGNDTRAAHFNYVGDSVLGSRVNLGAGAKLANVRFDKKKVHDLLKCGAMLADDVQIGCNAVLDPGVMLESGVWFAGAHVPAQDAPYTRETIKKYFF